MVLIVVRRVIVLVECLVVAVGIAVDDELL